MVPQYLAFVVWLVFLLIIFYFVLIRPQQRRTQRHNALVSGLKIGDRVVTIGGLHGKIRSLNDDTATVELASEAVVMVDRNAIGRKHETEEGAG